MKKLLAMVLALVMTLSLAVSANAAFKDADKVSADYSEAVAVLNGMGVFKGYEDGSFKPEGNITRAEVATIIYRIYTATSPRTISPASMPLITSSATWLAPVGLRATSATAPTLRSSRVIPTAPSSPPVRSRAMRSSR